MLASDPAAPRVAGAGKRPKGKSALFYELHDLRFPRLDAALPADAEADEERVLLIDGGELLPRVLPTADLRALLQTRRATRQFVWLDVQAPSVGTLASLAEAYQLLGLPLSAASEAAEAGAAHHGLAWLILVHEPRPQDPDAWAPLAVVLDRTSLLTLHPARCELLPALLASLRPVGAATLAAHPECAVYALLLLLGRTLLLRVDALLAEVHNLDALVLATAAKDELDFLERISRVRLAVMELQRRLLAHQDVLRALISDSESERFLPEVHQLLRELQAAQGRGLRNLDVANGTLEQLGSVYLGRISLEVNSQSSDASDSMRRFNAIATVMIPLLFLQGVFSMNIGVPGKGVDNLRWWWSINAACVLLCVVVLVVLKRIKYL